MTPGAPSPGGYNPHTPGSNIEQGSSDWVTTDILVRVKDSFMDLMGQMGVIRSVTVRPPPPTHTSEVLSHVLSWHALRSEKPLSVSSEAFADTPTRRRRPSDLLSSLQGGMCSVFMQESEKVVSISSDQLEPVTPTKNNKVRSPAPLLPLGG